MPLLIFKMVDSMTYRLLNDLRRPLEIFIEDSAKGDFMKLMGWSELEWDFHTTRINGGMSGDQDAYKKK